MSLDFSLKKKMPTDVFEINITHNLNTMAGACGIYNCLWRPEENGFKYASELIPILTDAIVQLESKPDHFKTFNPENGWGDYDGFLNAVKLILKGCKANPDALIDVWR